MDAKGSRVDSSIPANANADTSLDINSNILSTSTFSHNAYPISLEHGAQQPRSNPDDMSVIQESLGNLKLAKDNEEAFSQNRAPNLYASGGEASINILDNPSELEAVSTPLPGMSARPSSLLKSPTIEHSF